MARLPGSGTLEEEVAALMRRVAALERGRPDTTPVCQITLPLASVTLAVNSDNFARDQWAPVAGGDPDGLFTPGTAAGVNAQIRIPCDGRYLVSNRATGSGLTSGALIARVLLNGGYIVSDEKPAVSGASTRPHAHREVLLKEGDVITWAYAPTAACNLLGDPAGLNTEMLVRYVARR